MILQLSTTGQRVSTRMDEERFDTGCLFHRVHEQGGFYRLESLHQHSGHVIAVMFRYTIKRGCRDCKYGDFTATAVPHSYRKL
jgi:hypothetical protein